MTASLLGAGLTWWSVRDVRISAAWLIGVALLLRLVVLPLGPSLSDDGYRYLWDGALTAQGLSPYAETPRDALDQGFRPPVPLEALNSPDYHSVYPPVSQGVFALAMVLGGSFRAAWWIYKLVLVLVELGGVWALAHRLRPSVLALYAWHPVSIVEVAGQGHTEGLAIGFLSLALAAVSAERPVRGGMFLSLAGWVKLWPFAMAVLLRPLRLRWVLAVSIPALLLASPWLYGVSERGVWNSLSLYGGTFDFYSLPYSVLKVTLWTALEDASGQWAARGLAMVAVTGLVVVALWRNRLPVHVLVGVGTIVLVLLSSTLHPWHLLPVLWAAVLIPRRWRLPPFWLVSFAPLTYLLYTGSEDIMPVALLLGWGGAGLLALYGFRGPQWIDWVLKRRGQQKWERMREIIPTDGTSRILDLGCAEGYVGEAASLDGHTVILADVYQDRSFALPFVRVQEQTTPMHHNSVDTAVLVFVLHHAEEPASVLAEAERVASRFLVVWETVPAPWAPKPLLENIDTFVNRSGHREIRKAELRSPGEWEALFEATGLVVEKRLQWGLLHPQALWLLKCPEDSVNR
ncbi:MAG: methyltransferase domain-containing protein [Bacteroidota bacterium]